MMAVPILDITYDLSGLAGAVQSFWQNARTHHIWAISGEMGAGKTTFMHALCNALGVQDSVSSPTYAIINEYHFPDEKSERTLYHMDWYRLRDEEEARAAGVEDCLLQNGAYCAIEWPERAPGLLLMPHLQVRIEVIAPDIRRLIVAQI